MANHSVSTAFVGLGGNLGDRERTFRDALAALDRGEDVSVQAVSDFIETPPLGGADQPAYLNAVARLATSLEPAELLETLHGIEDRLGRTRQSHWTSRSIDLDLLLYEDRVVQGPYITLPHPQMHLRSFVLEGMCQLDPERRHPILGQTMETLRSRLGGRDFWLSPDRCQLISIAGLIGVGKTTLACTLAGRLSCPMVAEAYDQNPYLPRVYAGRSDLALESQLFFLRSRVNQLDPQCLPVGRAAVSDYVFQKDRIFAARTLTPEQWQGYHAEYRRLRTAVVRPVLTICLTDTPERCLERIHARNRTYEQSITLQTLADFQRDYEDLFRDWPISPLMRLDVREFNVFNTEHVDRLIREIGQYVYVGSPAETDNGTGAHNSACS